MGRSRPIAVLAAHDPGGANFIAPVVPGLRDLGFEVRAYAAGPALSAWRARGIAVSDESEAVLPQKGVLLTGTSVDSALERRLWTQARAIGLPSVGAVDSWFGFKPRFAMDGTSASCFPDTIAVPDTECAQNLQNCIGGSAQISVVGQPFLEEVWERCGTLAQVKMPIPAEVLFVSEDVREHVPDAEPGTDQFATAELLLRVLSSEAPKVKLAIRPHPREDPHSWLQWIGWQTRKTKAVIELDTRTSDESIASACVVVGINSMMLIESAAGGVPTLAIRLQEQMPENPCLRLLLGPPLNDLSAATKALSRILKLPRGRREPLAAPEFVQGSTNRLLQLLDSKAARPVSMPTRTTR